MKRYAFLIISLVVFAASAFGQKSASAAAGTVAGPRETFERLVDGIKQVDAAKVMSTYEKSDKLLVFNNNGTATIGYDTVKSNTESAYAKVSNVTLEITGLRVEMLGKTAAYVSCKWKQSQENNSTLR